MESWSYALDMIILEFHVSPMFLDDTGFKC